ncbi:hypothetical protein [Polyangium spumosum]|uniref:Uncharacterized protein n=1 Tax=Polyangium spumosum TaxID=889282 RepID=A0A6N7Q2C3_9BACT|nr:hypothetical protein [Polyangium spumosum]MRG97857.1 hypothetical protein [Polyangium spumosum]
MAGDPKFPDVGEQHIDASDLTLPDITAERVQGLTKVHDGYEDVARLLINAKPDVLDRAGINPKDIERLSEEFAKEQRLTKLHAASVKLTELLFEGRQETRHVIGTLVAEAAAQTRRRAERTNNPAEVIGPLESLLEYQYGAAQKGAATRQKAKEAKGPKKD